MYQSLYSTFHLNTFQFKLYLASHICKKYGRICKVLWKMFACFLLMRYFVDWYISAGQNCQLHLPARIWPNQLNYIILWIYFFCFIVTVDIFFLFFFCLFHSILNYLHKRYKLTEKWKHLLNYAKFWSNLQYSTK